MVKIYDEGSILNCNNKCSVLSGKANDQRYWGRNFLDLFSNLCFLKSLTRNKVHQTLWMCNSAHYQYCEQGIQYIIGYIILCSKRRDCYSIVLWQGCFDTGRLSQVKSLEQSSGAVLLIIDCRKIVLMVPLELSFPQLSSLLHTGACTST